MFDEWCAFVDWVDLIERFVVGCAFNAGVVEAQHLLQLGFALDLLQERGGD